MNPSLVIIPTYNEADNIKSIIKVVINLPISLDILIVDDNSPDCTADLVDDIKSKNGQVFLIRRNKKDGLGPAYIHGFKWALEKKYKFIFEMDADFSHPPNALISMLEILMKDKADMVIGSRYKQGISVRNWPISRIVLSIAASLYVRLITGLPVNDPTAGFVGYKIEVLQKIEFDKISFKGYAFQIALKFDAWKNNFRIFELPIIFTDRIAGESKMNRSIISEAIFGIIYMKLKSFFNKK